MWKAYALEAGLDVAKDLAMNKLIEKGEGGNNPEMPITPGDLRADPSWNNYIDKFIRYGLMVHGPGTVYLAPNLDPDYPDYTYVQYWFKGYYGYDRKPIFDVKPIKLIIADENPLK